MTARLGIAAAVVVAVLVAAGCGGSSGPKGPPTLLFVSVKDGDYAIFGADANGKHAYRLSKEKGDPSTPQGLFFQGEPAWSQNGTRIAFTSNRDGRTHIFVMKPDGTGTRRVTDTEHSDNHPSWSPDGRVIVFEREGALYRVRSTGGTATRVGKGFGASADPAYSPDGKLIAYDYRQPGYSIKEIYVMSADGTDNRRVTDLREVSSYPAWSPDGSTLAFQSTLQNGRNEIFTVPMKGGTPKRLTSSDVDAIQPAWTRDGKGVTFSRDGALVTIEDGKETKLTSGENNDSAPAWRPVRPQ